MFSSRNAGRQLEQSLQRGHREILLHQRPQRHHQELEESAAVVAMDLWLVMGLLWRIAFCGRLSGKSGLLLKLVFFALGRQV